MPAGYVKPNLKRRKNDEVDAEAICEAVEASPWPQAGISDRPAG